MKKMDSSESRILGILGLPGGKKRGGGEGFARDNPRGNGVQGILV